MIWPQRWRWLIIALAFGLAPVWIWLAYQRFSLLTDRREMLAPQARTDWSNFERQFDYRNDFMVLAYDSETLNEGQTRPSESAIEELGQRLSKEPLLDSLFWKVEARSLATSTLYFLPLERLREIQALLTSARPWLGILSHSEGLRELLDSLSDTRSPARQAERIRPLLAVLNEVVEALSRNIDSRGQEAYVSPFSGAQPEIEMLQNRHVRPGQSVFYYTLADGRTYVLLARARLAAPTNAPRWTPLTSDYATHLAALRALKGHLAAVRKSHPEVNFFVTGEAALETAEIEGALKDILRCGILGFFLLGLATTSGVGCPRALGCIVLSTGVAGCWLAGLDAAVGPLTILTVNHWLLAGVTSLWWSFHIVLRFLLNLRQENCVERAWKPLAASWQLEARWFLGASSLLWVCVYLRGGSSLAQLSIYCLLSLLVVALQVGLLLPALLTQAYCRNPASGASGKAFHLPTQWIRSAIWLSHRRGFTGILRLFCILTLLGLPRLSLDSNLLNLPAVGMQAKQIENYLQPLKYSTLYALSVADDLNQAEKLRRLFLEQPSVGRVESILQLLPREIAAKRRLIPDIIDLARKSPLPALPAPRNAARLLEMQNSFQNSQEGINLALTTLTQNSDSATRRQVERLQKGMQQLRLRLDPSNPGPVAEGLAGYERALVDDIKELLVLLRKQSGAAPDVLADLPPELKLRTLNGQGKVLMRIYPSSDCWNLPALQSFVRDLRRVDPNVTGTPSLLLNFMREVKLGLSRAALAFVVSGLALLGLYALVQRWRGQSSHSAQRIIFPLIAGLWSLGLAGLLGLDFNGLNVWLWLLSLHIGWLYALALGASNRDNCGEPVFLACVLMLASLTFLSAQHFGVKSCATMFSLGVLSQLLTSFAWPDVYWRVRHP